MTATVETVEYRTPGRAILKCRTCKHAGSVSYELVTAWQGHRPVGVARVQVAGAEQSGRLDTTRRNPVAWYLARPCTACGSGDVAVSVVNGTMVDGKVCDARCLAATGPNCECACGGKAHGGKHGAF